MVDCDGHKIHSENERYEAAMLLAYRVQFKDGSEFDVMEDELLDSKKEFTRPKPPKKPKES